LKRTGASWGRKPSGKGGLAKAILWVLKRKIDWKAVDVKALLEYCVEDGLRRGGGKGKKKGIARQKHKPTWGMCRLNENYQSM